MASLARAAKELLPQAVAQERAILSKAFGGASSRPWNEGPALGFRRAFMQDGTSPIQAEAGKGSNSASSMQERIETVKETVQGLGDIGREVVKSVQRDAGKMAEMVKENTASAMDTSQQIGEVGKMVAKSIQRDTTVTTAKAMESMGVGTETAGKLKEAGERVGKTLAEEANLAKDKTQEGLGGSVQDNVKKASDAVGEQVEKGKNALGNLTGKAEDTASQTKEDPTNLVDLGIQTGDKMWQQVKNATNTNAEAK